MRATLQALKIIVDSFLNMRYCIRELRKNMTCLVAKSRIARKHQGDIRSNQRNNRWFGVGLFSGGMDTL